MSAPAPISPRGWLLLLTLGAIWGGAFFFARIAVQEIPPLTLVFLRVTLAATALWIYALAMRIPLGGARPYLLTFLGLSLLNNIIPFSLMFLGQTEIGAGLASVLNATTPFWTMLLANAVLADDKLSPRRVAGVVLGIAGAAVMVGPGLAAGLGGPVWAKLALIGTAVSYAFATVYTRLFKGLRPEVMAVGQMTGSTVIMLPIVLLFQDLSLVADASGSTWAAVVALALMATALAYIIFFRLIETVGPSNTSLVTLLVRRLDLGPSACLAAASSDAPRVPRRGHRRRKNGNEAGPRRI